MDNIFEELGIPRKYLKTTSRENQYIALVHKLWLKSLMKHSKIVEFIERGRLESWPVTDEELGTSWAKIFVRVFKKRDVKVIPLPRIRTLVKDDAPLLFPQLMQYISQTNYKNLWKEAYKKYSTKPETCKETQVTLADYNGVLKEIIVRIYGCPIVNVCDPTSSVGPSKQFDVHLSILPAICAVETLNAIFLLHSPFLEHNLKDCVTFSPAILDSCYSKPLFVIYQLLNTLKSLHDHSLTLGDIQLSDIYLTEDMWVYVFPAINSNIYVQDAPQLVDKKTNSNITVDCRKSGHNFGLNLKCEVCGLKTYDKVQVANESLETLCQLWIEGQISNFTYISALNRLSGRKLGDPNCHYVFPWVTDFATRCGKNWRDLKKSKYRLNKGDRQLDLTYESSQSQVPHHVSDVLSSITYYVYMARRTPKSVLCKNVRTIWVPAEYPSSIQRMQEWTPDECIPEFFTDPSVFRSIHDDLDDLEVPPWCSGPEEFIEKHREALESQHVSERLHHWIDLTFGYKLAGNAAIRSKNVCLHLVDDHSVLTKSGIVQLFTYPHPPRAVSSIFFSKSPPKLLTNRPAKQKSRDRSSSPAISLETKSDDEDLENILPSSSSNRSPLGLSRFLSRSRSSLNEEQQNPLAKPSKTSTNQRSASVGPKNATFTSHVNSTAKGRNSNANSICLPKDYRPEHLLDNLEKKHAFFSQTFHLEEGRKFKKLEPENLAVTEDVVPQNDEESGVIQNAFTNRIFAEIHEKAIKSHSFPLDKHNLYSVYAYKSPATTASQTKKNVDQIVCNYSEIISARRIRELQILGCLIVEIFMSKQLRALGLNDSNSSFNGRLKACLTIVNSCRKEIPGCVSNVVRMLLQPDVVDFSRFKYPPVSDLGLPPPSAHLLLEPHLHCLVPFPKLFPKLYRIIAQLKDFKNVAVELNILYHFDCNGEMCHEYENLERTRILFAQNIGECTVKDCAKRLESFLTELNPNTDGEIIGILLPHVKELIEDPPTSVLAAWYLFDSVSKVLGPRQTTDHLLESLLKLYENEPNECTLPYNAKIAKLYHHSFLLRLIVRLGLKCFLDNFITPLVEAVGRYKDADNQTEFILHTHSEKVARKTSHLKTMDNEQNDMSTSEDSSASSDKKPPVQSEKSQGESRKVVSEPEIFDFEEQQTDDNLRSLMEQLELNITSDLPFNHSGAEEALDATLIENLEQLRSLEELKINLTDEETDVISRPSASVTSPTIPIPPSESGSKCNELGNVISCEVGSKRSDSLVSDKKSLSESSTNSNNLMDKENESQSSNDPHQKSAASSKDRDSNNSKKQDATISDMSSDSLIWLSHRLGPVLTARYLSRNLLKMLTLCYVGRDNLTCVSKEEHVGEIDSLSVVPSYVLGDQNAIKVLECLTSIAGLYGEQLILFQYIPHMSELIALCKRKLTPNLEGGLISCLSLLKHIIPYLSDSTLMDQLQDVILKTILHPIVRLLGSTKYTFPSGHVARNVLARKYVDALYVLSVRMGSDMTRTHLAVPALQRFFMIFDKVHDVKDEDGGNNRSEDGAQSMPISENDDNIPTKPESRSVDNTHHKITDGAPLSSDRSFSDKPFQVNHFRLRDSESSDTTALPPFLPHMISSSGGGEEKVLARLSREELRNVFTSELAHTCYVPFLKHVGASSLEISLKNHQTIRELCQRYEEQEIVKPQNTTATNNRTRKNPSDIPPSGSIGSNIALIGNRIDIQENYLDSLNTTTQDNALNLVSNRMENNGRHLRGNWLAYWEHEIGRSDKDNMFNFKQIKLQTFAGHSNSVKCLQVLDNENSFMSGSRDKTVKLWSLRSQGDGTSISNCQWTYTAHKKSVLSLTFIESLRLVASCDSVVHIWDPFLGVNVGHLESPRYAPVNVLRTMPPPSTLFFAATTDGTVKIVDSRLCNYVYELRVNHNLTGLIRCLAIAPSGQWLAAGQSSGTITVLDTRTGMVMASWRAHEGEVLQLVALDDHALVSSSLDQSVSVWSVHDGRFRFNMRGTTEPVHCLTVYNGSELISGTTANRIGVHTSIDPEASFSSTKLRSDAFKGLLTSMALLPLNRLLLLGADTGHVSLLC